MPFQNASSRLTLVLWPPTRIERFTTGDLFTVRTPARSAFIIRHLRPEVNRSSPGRSGIGLRVATSGGGGIASTVWSAPMAAVVEGFGCRPATSARHTPVAGVRKPPRKEPAGDGAWRMPRTALWGFG